MIDNVDGVAQPITDDPESLSLRSIFAYSAHVEGRQGDDPFPVFTGADNLFTIRPYEPVKGFDFRFYPSNRLIVLDNIMTFSMSYNSNRTQTRIMGRKNPAGLTVGCMARDTIIMTGAGRKMVEDINIGDMILSLDQNEDKVVYSKCINKMDSGLQRCYRITSTPYSDMELTAKHRVYTFNRGWQVVSDLEVNDMLINQIGYEYETCNTNNDEIISDDYIKLLAYGLGDGVFAKYDNERSMYLTPGPHEKMILNDIISSCDNINLNYRIQEADTCTYVYFNNTIDEPTWYQNREYHGFFNFIESTGLFGKKSREKFIPEIIFRQSKDKISLFLNRIFSTDGFYSGSTENRSRVGYTSTSKRLIDGISDLLNMIGIRTRVSVENVHKMNLRDEIKHNHDAYTLYVTEHDVWIFESKVGIYSKKLAIKPKLWFIRKYVEQYADMMGVSVRKKLNASRNIYSDIGGEKVKYALDDHYNEFISWYLQLNNYIYLSKIKSIDEIEIKQTYDLEIGHTNNLFGKFLVHNSRTVGGTIVTHYSVSPGLLAGHSVFSESGFDYIKDGKVDDKFYDVMKELLEDSGSLLTDSMAPFDMYVRANNESGYEVGQVIYGISIVSGGEVKNVNDMTIEVTYQYIAHGATQTLPAKLMDSLFITDKETWARWVKKVSVQQNKYGFLSIGKRRY